MFIEKDSVATYISTELSGRVFLGGRPGTSINVWKTWANWEKEEKGWFISYHSAFVDNQNHAKRLLEFFLERENVTPFNSTPTVWRTLKYHGKCDVLPYEITFSFIDTDSTEESKTIPFREPHDNDVNNFVRWFGNKLGFGSIRSGSAPKPPREGVADLFHLWENRMVRGWKITDMDLLVFEDQEWTKVRAIVEIKRSSEPDWKPRSNDPHDVLALTAKHLNVPYVLIHHNLDPRKTNTMPNKNTTVDVLFWRPESGLFDFEKFSNSRKSMHLSKIIGLLSRPRR